MSNQIKKRIKKYLNTRVTAGLVCVVILVLVYVFQGVDFLSYITGIISQRIWHPYVIFIFNKTLRLIINDMACFIIIWAIFQSPKHLKLAFYIFLFEILFILPFYFWIKLLLEGDSEISSPLLSQIHRLIVNPTLMILLIISFAYQRYKNHFYTS